MGQFRPIEVLWHEAADEGGGVDSARLYSRAETLYPRHIP